MVNTLGIITIILTVFIASNGNKYTQEVQEKEHVIIVPKLYEFGNELHTFLLKINEGMHQPLPTLALTTFFTYSVVYVTYVLITNPHLPIVTQLEYLTVLMGDIVALRLFLPAEINVVIIGHNLGIIGSLILVYITEVITLHHRRLIALRASLLERGLPLNVIDEIIEYAQWADAH